jgi:hypothetical protein
MPHLLHISLGWMIYTTGIFLMLPKISVIASSFHKLGAYRAYPIFRHTNDLNSHKSGAHAPNLWTDGKAWHWAMTAW